MRLSRPTATGPDWLIFFTFEKMIDDKAAPGEINRARYFRVSVARPPMGPPTSKRTGCGFPAQADAGRRTDGGLLGSVSCSRPLTASSCRLCESGRRFRPPSSRGLAAAPRDANASTGSTTSFGPEMPGWEPARVASTRPRCPRPTRSPTHSADERSRSQCRPGRARNAEKETGTRQGGASSP